MSSWRALTNKTRLQGEKSDGRRWRRRPWRPWRRPRSGSVVAIAKWMTWESRIDPEGNRILMDKREGSLSRRIPRCGRLLDGTGRRSRAASNDIQDS